MKKNGVIYSEHQTYPIKDTIEKLIQRGYVYVHKTEDYMRLYNYTSDDSVILLKRSDTQCDVFHQKFLSDIVPNVDDEKYLYAESDVHTYEIAQREEHEKHYPFNSLIGCIVKLKEWDGVCTVEDLYYIRAFKMVCKGAYRMELSLCEKKYMEDNGYSTMPSATERYWEYDVLKCLSYSGRYASGTPTGDNKGMIIHKY